MLKRTITAILLAACFIAGCRSQAYHRRKAMDNRLAQAQAHLDRNDLYRAMQAYNAILQDDPHNGRAYLGLGRVALKHGDYLSALIPLEKALKAGRLDNAGEDEVRRLLGKSYHRSGKSTGKAWAHLYPLWKKGGRNVKEDLASEIHTLAKKVPESTRGVREVRRYYSTAPVIQAVPNKDGLAIHPRQAWNAQPVSKKRPMIRMGKPTRITVHHSAHDTGTVAKFHGTKAGAAKLVRGIQRHHMETNHWLDIGYHYVIGPMGHIWAGRDMKFEGAHAGGPKGANNKHNIGIVLIGNFCDRKPSSLQTASLKKLVAWLQGRYKLDRRKLYGHCDLDHTATQCPGRHLLAIVQSMK